MPSLTPITSGSVHQTQHDPQQTGLQKKSTNSEPSKGSQADHPIYRNKTAAGKRPPAHEDAAKPFQYPSTAPHSALLENPYDRRKFVKLLPMLGRLAARCAQKALTQKEWQSTYRVIEAATALNDQCRNNLKEHAPGDHFQDILTTAKALKSVLDAVQRNRAVFARIRTFLR